MDISQLQLESSDENEVGKVLDSLLEMLSMWTTPNTDLLMHADS